MKEIKKAMHLFHIGSQDIPLNKDEDDAYWRQRPVRLRSGTQAPHVALHIVYLIIMLAMSMLLVGTDPGWSKMAVSGLSC